MSALFVRIVAELAVLVLGSADVACAESSSHYRDGAVVLQVVANRARSGWARYDGTLMDALFEPGQHAHGCRWPITVEHLQLGVAFARGSIPAPSWARRALWYCGRWDRPGLCESRCSAPRADGARSGAPCEAVGGLAHTFYARPGEGR